MKSVASHLRLSLAQFRELAAFAQFSTDLDEETKHRIGRGQRLTELLKQPQYSPYAIWEQVAVLLAANEGCFDHVPLADIKKAQSSLLSQLGREHKTAMDKLNAGDKPDDKTIKLIVDIATKITETYKSNEVKSQGEEKVA
jgi:F-type H+-transporting ATPase subunit alpha